MATMYSLFFSILLIAVCSVKGGRDSIVSKEKSFLSLYQGRDSFCRSVAATGPAPFVLTQKEPKSQGYIPLCYSFSKPLSKMELTSLRHHFAINGSCSKELSSRNIRPFFKAGASRNFKVDLQSVFLTSSQPRQIERVGASSSLQVRLVSPVKLLTIAQGGTCLQSKGSSDDFCFFLGKIAQQSPKETRSPSGDEDYKNSNKRLEIIKVAFKELGVREATGNNDGSRVEEYLHYTNLSKGHEWCAAFVSWCYGQAGLPEPRNPWSPALFPKARRIKESQVQPADLFGIYGATARRINHVGLVKERQGRHLITIEGNSNNRVESRRRHLRTLYAFAKWVG